MKRAIEDNVFAAAQVMRKNALHKRHIAVLASVYEFKKITHTVSQNYVGANTKGEGAA